MNFIEIFIPLEDIIFVESEFLKSYFALYYGHQIEDFCYLSNNQKIVTS